MGLAEESMKIKRTFIIEAEYRDNTPIPNMTIKDMENDIEKSVSMGMNDYSSCSVFSIEMKSSRINIPVPMADEMGTDRESVLAIVDAYQNLLRIKHADNKYEEIENQLMYLRTKLEICGVNYENLE